MSDHRDAPGWYALIVRPRHEKAVARDLRLRGLEEYLPLYRARRQWSDRVKSIELPLFPGYVFCRFSFRSRFQAVTTPGIVSVVGFGAGDVPVDESQLPAIRNLAASELPIEPCPYLRAGNPVRIEHGALAGLNGILVREKGSCRVVVNVELLQRAVAVEVDREFLSPAALSQSAAPFATVQSLDFTRLPNA